MPATTTRLQEKLDRIRKDPTGSRDFLICDAKDNDMGGRAGSTRDRG